MKPVVDTLQRDRWARLRFSIIGLRRAAPPPEGELQAALTSLVAKSWRPPLADKEIRFGVSTPERWYYAAKSTSNPVAAPRNPLAR